MQSVKPTYCGLEEVHVDNQGRFTLTDSCLAACPNLGKLDQPFWFLVLEPIRLRILAQSDIDENPELLSYQEEISVIHRDAKEFHSTGQREGIGWNNADI